MANGQTASIRRCRLGIGALWVAIAMRAVIAGATSDPTIEGPITGPGTPFVASTTFNLADVGYSEAEYFMAGTASAYIPTVPLTTDGQWSVTPASTAAYKTRILVRTPTNRSRFNGIVVVEWLNVSGGVDAAPDWIGAHVELIREGAAWVGVSAQQLGVEGGSSILGISLGLKTINPARYGSLSHPGDSFSYDIFSQAAAALRHPTGIDPLGGLKRTHVIGAGESQSAFRMVAYIDAIQPLEGLYDGFLVHSRGGGGAALSQAPQPAVNATVPAPIRADVGVPVLIFETETDLIILGYAHEEQADNPSLRLWEVAGTSHVDTYTLSVGDTDEGDSPSVANLVLSTTPGPGFTCAMPVNSGPQHFVLDAAAAALMRWVRHGTAPPHAPLIERTADATPTIARDAFGNALGGIRTPAVDAPIATLSGLGAAGTSFCFIAGTTTPFDAATLAGLYPSHAAYVRAVRQSVHGAVRGRFLQRRDARLIKAAARASSIGQ
jgi:hypothetical protein